MICFSHVQYYHCERNFKVSMTLFKFQFWQWSLAYHSLLFWVVRVWISISCNITCFCLIFTVAIMCIYLFPSWPFYSNPIIVVLDTIISLIFWIPSQFFTRVDQWFLHWFCYIFFCTISFIKNNNGFNEVQFVFF